MCFAAISMCRKFFMISLLLAATLLAQTQPARSATTTTMKLTVGRGDLIRFQTDVKQVAASEPKIADVVVISPREVMVNAKGPGRATVIVWDASPEPKRYDIDVVPDNFEFEEF